MANGIGAVTKSYKYDAFGVEKNIDEGDSNPFRYCGEYFDFETNNYYLRARNYSPTTGRFLSEDPVRSGLNWFTYCSNSPIRFIDPSGLVKVGLRDYASTYDGATVSWDEERGVATVSWNGKSFSIASTKDNNINGSIYVDDSVFVKHFGNGSNATTVYQSGNTVSIRTNVTASGTGSNKYIGEESHSLMYKELTRAGIEEQWSGQFGKYEVSTYVRTPGEDQDSIKVKIMDKAGVSNVNYGPSGWSANSPGKMTLYLGDSRRGEADVYTQDEFRWVSAHEFGHSLGVTDAYNSKNSTDVTSVYNRFGTAVQEVDISMILQANNTGKKQNWP